MVKERYYFALCALPSLSFDQTPNIKFSEVTQLIANNVSHADHEKLVAFLQYLDIKNMMLHWRGYPLDPRSNLNEIELEAMMLKEEFFPAFVFDFLHRYVDKNYRIRQFGSLLLEFYHWQEKKEKGFLFLYFQLERKFELIKTLLRAKKFSKNIAQELEYESPKDPIFESLIRSHENTQEAQWDRDYREIRKMYEGFFDQPLELQKRLAYYRFTRLEEMVPTFSYFTIDLLLAYLARLLIIEDWTKLTSASGKEKLQEWVSA